MQCPNCNAIFSMKAGLKAFSDKYQPKDQYIKCPQCTCVDLLNDFIQEEIVYE
jgi:uncharacterized C2H2 Zn-finger protein